jgi:hypothetical protein
MYASNIHVIRFTGKYGIGVPTLFAEHAGCVVAKDVATC